ncbi:hypothetical protein ACIBTV_27815 [Micromonospora sp. NPDC049366]|uniref:hypothetical protein n=1 Tax=Micromonospora sp. NPDC049366 TaxID=3364271 RepID=UPI0037B68BFB
MPASRAQQAQTAKRRRDAIQLRLAGADWDTIAERLGYASRGAACTDVTRAMEKAAAEAVRDADVLRQVELDRINRLQLAYWPKAIGGDTDAARVVQWCIDRRAKLTGLDAPIKHQVVTMGAIEAAIAELEAQLPPAARDALDAADLPPGL